MDLLLGFGAGLLTLINPCVLPVLPLAIGSALQDHRFGPLALAGGLVLTFVTLGLFVSAVGPVIGLDPETVSQFAAVLMIGFGLILLVPYFNRGFATATAGLSTQADSALHGLSGSGLSGQFMTGVLLGAVWSPCIGPTLGGAISLASQGENLVWAGAIMTAFALGVATVVLLLSYGTREMIAGRRDFLRRHAGRAGTVMGLLLIAVGASILLGLHHVIEGMLLDLLPAWLMDLSVAL